MMNILGKEIKMIVFDMAGTTVDEKNVVYKTIKKVICQHGIEVDLDTVLQYGAGKEKLQAIVDVLKSQDIEDIELANRIFASFKQSLNKEYEDLNVVPVEGVNQLFHKLKKAQIFIVLNTGYNRKIASLLLEKLKWQKSYHYDLLLTADDVKRGRPYPDMINFAMKKFGITDSSMVIKIGDSGIDIEEGKNAKCGLSIGVLSGAQNKQQLMEYNPDYILKSVRELI